MRRLLLFIARAFAALFVLAAFPFGSASENPTNLLFGGSFEQWSSGVGPGESTPPDGWLSGQPYSTFTREATIKLIGSYSLKLSNTTGNSGFAEAYQNINLYNPNWTQGMSWDIGYWKGKTVSFGCWVYASVADVARLILNDDVTQSFSAFHPGDSTWRFLTVTKTMSGSATAFQVAVFIVAGSPVTSIYADGAILAECGQVPAFAEMPLVWGVNKGQAGAGVKTPPIVFPVMLAERVTATEQLAIAGLTATARLYYPGAGAGAGIPVYWSGDVGGTDKTIGGIAVVQEDGVNRRGRMYLLVSRDGNPAIAVTINSDKSAEFLGGVVIPSPNGSLWKITVSNTGVLSATAL